MDCNETRRWLDAYVDGELALDRGAELESHINSCRECGTAAKAVASRRKAIRELLPAYPASARLRKRVRAALREEAAPSFSHGRLAMPWFVRWVGALAAAAACLVAGFEWGGARQRAMEVGNEALANHIRSLQASHLLDVVSSDQHTVKPWFAGKLDFSLPVADYAGQGFVLAGGRLDRFAGHDAAALVYRHGAHVVNVFIWPRRGPGLGRSAREARGFHLIEWSSGDLNYTAVSDTAGADLQRLSDLISPR